MYSELWPDFAPIAAGKRGRTTPAYGQTPGHVSSVDVAGGAAMLWAWIGTPETLPHALLPRSALADPTMRKRANAATASVPALPARLITRFHHCAGSASTAVLRTVLFVMETLFVCNTANVEGLPRVRLSGDLKGDYVVLQRHANGVLRIAPEQPGGCPKV